MAESWLDPYPLCPLQSPKTGAIIPHFTDALEWLIDAIWEITAAGVNPSCLISEVSEVGSPCLLSQFSAVH